MKTKLFIITAILCLASPSGLGNSFRAPMGLEGLNYSTVYSIGQEESGAIWFHTNRGVCRFNGHDTEFRSTPCPWGLLASKDGTRFYAAYTTRKVLSFPVSSVRSDTLNIDGPVSPEPVLLDEGDSLLVGTADRLLVFMAGAKASEWQPLEGCEITALIRGVDGSLVVGTRQDGILIFSPEGERSGTLPIGSEVRALMPEADGSIWAGLREGGFFRFDPVSLKITSLYSSCEGKTIRDCRSFCKDTHGNLHVGTADGLFLLTPDNLLMEEPLGGNLGRPVCCVFCDREGNLWVGTYYNGVFYSDPDSFPMKPVIFDTEALIVKGLSEDRDHHVWILTDGYGMYRCDIGSGQAGYIPGTKGIKYQCSYFDAQTNCIWAGEYQGDLLAMDIATGKEYRYQISAQEPGKDKSPRTIIRVGDDLILGGMSGLFWFRPGEETTVTRKVSGFDGPVYDMEPGPDGRLYIAGQGVYVMDSPDKVSPMDFKDDTESWIWDASCYDIAFDCQDRMWLAFARRGVACLDGEDFIRYYHTSCGIADDFTSRIIPCGNGHILVVTNSGISILHPEDKACFNYDKSNGLNFGSARGCTSLVLSDGTVWVGGNDGIESVPTVFPPVKTGPLSVILDKLYVNGKRFDTGLTLPFRQNIRLSHAQNNFSFDVASFDFSGAAYTDYLYKLEGFDKEWTSFRPENPVSYMNIKPGRYVFRVRAERKLGGEIAEASVNLRIRPAWYATLSARILFILLAATIIITILHGLYSQMILTEKVKLKERENMEKTRFFVNLSYRLRTPVNLIIGQMEQFFRNFGSRAGIEDLEDIYVKAKQMRSLISDYVDAQNGEQEKAADPDEGLPMVYKNAKFLNAAIGAVERHLYSKDLNVMTLCSELNVGKTTLTSKIKEASGLTPREFIEDIRLKHAAQMLRDGVYRVAEVADSLAFSSPKYFAQRFKLKYGVSPRDYKIQG